MRAPVAMVAAAMVAACGSTAQEYIELPLHGAGTGAMTFVEGAWSVTIERADVALGPLYLCASSFADLDTCPTAYAEWLGTAPVDALDDAPQMLGDARAITSTVRTAMLDYGRSWLLAEPRPRASEGAPEGHSAVFVVRASHEDGTTLEVRASVDVDPSAPGQSAIFGVPLGTQELEGDEALIIRLDPVAWWRGVDFDRLAAADEGDGVVELARGDAAYDVLLHGMTNRAVPAFEWTQP